MLLTYGLTTLLAVVGVWKLGTEWQLRGILKSERDRVSQILIAAVWLIHSYIVFGVYA